MVIQILFVGFLKFLIKRPGFKPQFIVNAFYKSTMEPRFEILFGSGKYHSNRNSYKMVEQMENGTNF